MGRAGGRGASYIGGHTAMVQEPEKAKQCGSGTCSMGLKRGLSANGTLPSTKPLKKKFTTMPMASCTQR